MNGCELEAERRADHPPPDRAFGDEPGKRGRLRVVPPHEAFREDEPLAVGEVERLFGVRCPRGERLLAEHVLPRSERSERPLHVQRIREEM